MNYIKIDGIGIKLPKQTVAFGNTTRYRISEKESQMTLAVDAIKGALSDANRSISEIDLIVSTCSVGIQLLPNMSSLIHEQVPQGMDIPCIDINTTCSSFITALDTMSYLIEAGKYKNVLIISSEVPSLALNPNQKKSFELFSDCGVAMVVSKDESKGKGIRYALQKTYSEGAHCTEIKGGGTGFLPERYDGSNGAMYQFDMNGKEAIKLTRRKIVPFVEQIKKSINVEIDYVIPHQASLVLDTLMKKIGFKEDKFLSIVKSHGNMVSASIPFAFKYAVDEGLIKRGDHVLLLGTAAGLHLNGLVLTY